MHTTQQQDAAPIGRVLARRLARELGKEEIEAVAGGMMKTRDFHGTACEPWGDLDDGGDGDPYGNP
ncbi:MAG: hypothetical protein JSR59_12825 [Proteobacteria bacterium]|nr:hypothetical protein [Pseudomonadota bacterium]